ncbi:MAG TPA: hypothetical protein DCY94_02830 [Firmicutes bacterium]|nr:hypothetical protein [Bacillota bacterium]
MKESVWAWWFLVLGLLMIAVIIVITDITTTSDQNYYMLKEISEASMMESVDYAYYRKYGDLRINSEKFMENFIRRYSEIVTINKTSKLSFYDIYESPPKVTVEISTRSTQILINTSSETFDITNRLDAILEMYEEVDPTPYN